MSLVTCLFLNFHNMNTCKTISDIDYDVRTVCTTYSGATYVNHISKQFYAIVHKYVPKKEMIFTIVYNESPPKRHSTKEKHADQAIDFFDKVSGENLSYYIDFKSWKK